MSDILRPPWTVACQAPLSGVFSRQEYWSGLPFPSPIWAYRGWHSSHHGTFFHCFPLWDLIFSGHHAFLLRLLLCFNEPHPPVASSDTGQSLSFKSELPKKRRGHHLDKLIFLAWSQLVAISWRDTLCTVFLLAEILYLFGNEKKLSGRLLCLRV